MMIYEYLKSNDLEAESERLAGKLEDAGPSIDEARVWVRELVNEAWRAGYIVGQADSVKVERKEKP